VDIIPRTDDWKNALLHAVRDPAELCALLELPVELHQQAQNAAKTFPMRVPRGFIARMRKGDIHDPLLRQILPMDDEMNIVAGFSDDPVGDIAASVRPGVLHKYHGRLLLTVTGACGIHCRYCFRRHFPYPRENPFTQDWQATLEYIKSNKTINEIILSGGDPLMLETHRLRQFTEQLEDIPHLKRLRLHSRLPVVIPERIDPELLEWLTRTALKLVMVIHANHAHELAHEVGQSLAHLHRAGVVLMNQAVLLRGVNDDVASLRQLSERLFELNVQPYYLHLLDRVSGAAHFEVPEDRALDLVHELRSQLSGYLIPTLVREIEGTASKVPAGV
jgi:EF-P beta-lysylation protein EpmB